jgi:hypothetical protein
MTLLGKGVVFIWNDIAKGFESEFLQWHSLEHMAERVRITGWLRGRRYSTENGPTRHLTFYEAEDLSRMDGGEYAQVIANPTEWSRGVIPLFRNTKRSACRVDCSLGAGAGGHLMALDFVAGGPSLQRWLSDNALPKLIAAEGVVGAHLCSSDTQITNTTRQLAQTRRMIGGDAPLAGVVLVVEGISRASVAGAVEAAVNRRHLAALGVTLSEPVGVYDLDFTILAAEA